MPATESSFHEAKLGSTRLQDLGLTLAGSPLEPILKEFETELARAGIRRLRPRFYLSTEWGVPFGTVAVAIPFYLARSDLTALHAKRAGYVEGLSRWDILRYLRHEMGHVVNYAYRLYEQQEWIKHFGSITQPYEEDYRPEPFSRRYVRHLNGWYAQKHPDEDWAETFAVWMTPGLNWRAEYADWPVALAKLNFCNAIMEALADREPSVTATDLDEDVQELAYSLDQYYKGLAPDRAELPPGLDGALRTIFEDLARDEEMSPERARQPASVLIRRLEPGLMTDVYRWTGHFPERTYRLLEHLAVRADHLQLAYSPERELQASVALTTLATALAMNYVHRGSYLP
jgi:Putative zinc-binding metallo-peptidase